MTMKDKIRLTVPVQGGKCKFSDAQLANVRAFLAKLDGKAVTIEWSKPRNTRSLRQNAYYWGVVLTIIGEETGNTADDLHTVYKEMFLTPKFITLGKKEIELRRTTTDLTTAEFGQYLERIIAHAATELGISIPEASW